jgi:hypothetical protein
MIAVPDALPATDTGYAVDRFQIVNVEGDAGRSVYLVDTVTGDTWAESLDSQRSWGRVVRSERPAPPRPKAK